MLRWCAFLLLAGVAWAGSAEVQPAADTRALPGAYATLLFEVWGQGEVELRALVPQGWPNLPLPKRLVLAGRSPVPLTVRVPELTPAGSEHPLILQAWQGERLLGQASATVTVLRKADLIVFVEGPPETRMGEPVSYRVAVINRGNARDRIVLEAESNTGEAYLQPAHLELDPGQEGRATLTLQIGAERRVSSGYTMVTWVRARSGNGEVQRKVRVATRWVDPAALGASGPDPALRLLLSGSLGLGARVESGEFGPLEVRYAVRPSLSGQLSDFVEASVRPSTLRGRSPTWWPEGPAGFNLGLKGSGWDASFAANQAELAAQTGFRRGSWRYGASLRGRYDLEGFGLGVDAVSLQRDLNLQLNASTRSAGGSRQDRFGVDYSRPLGEAFSLRLGARLNGLATDRYRVVGSARQGLLWQGRRFSVLESLSASPQLGLYTLTFTGGTRSVHPLGVRGTALLQQRTEGLGWKTSASVFAAPLPRFSLRVTTAIEDEAARPLQLLLQPSVNFRAPNLGGFRSSFSAGYALRYTPETASGLQRITASAELGFGSFGLSGRGGYALVGPRRHDLKVNARWRPSPLTVLQSRYAIKLEDERSEELGLSWQQYWGAGFASELEVTRRASEGVRDRLGFFLAQKSLGGSPFGLVLGYSLSDDDGLGRGSPRLTHAFSVRLGYNFAWQFDTPEPVVNAFGGRRVGRVSGLAFIDTNLNGHRDPGEPPVPGLKVRMGGAEATTDAEGSYALLARPGTLEPRLERLPATLDLYRPTEVVVREGKRHRLDLPLAPTAQLQLVLFHDANRNGVRDEGERGIAYGGVRLVGPTHRTFRTDAAGWALATGLLPGSYRVEPDPGLLPPRFKPTQEAVRLELAPGGAHPAVRVGAAPPPKEVRTTFDPGKLAVFANLSSPVVAAGAEFEVQVLAQGQPERVWVELDGRRFDLEPQSPERYRARLRLAPSTPPGPLTLRVHAERAAARAEARAVVSVVRRPLYRLDPLRLRLGAARPLEVRLLFKARDVRLLIEGAEALELDSEDGYRWTGSWSPAAAGTFAVRVVADGEELGSNRFTVLPAATGTK